MIVLQKVFSLVTSYDHYILLLFFEQYFFYFAFSLKL